MAFSTWIPIASEKELEKLARYEKLVILHYMIDNRIFKIGMNQLEIKDASQILSVDKTTTK